MRLGHAIATGSLIRHMAAGIIVEIIRVKRLWKMFTEHICDITIYAAQ